MSQCPYCQRTAQQVRVGINSAGHQRYLCKVCQRKYTPDKGPRGYGAEIRQQALQMYVDGLNLRRIGRLLGIDHQTVANWVNARAQELSDKPPRPKGRVKVSELDELFSFVGDKKTKSTSSPT
jgi:transposase-like protein